METLNKKLQYAAYRVIRALVWLFYPRTKVIGAENLPDGPAIIVGNHSQMHGPIATQLYFPGRFSIWCAGQMMHLREVPAYAYADFWSEKPKWQRPFWKGMSYLIAPIAVAVFGNADTIGVYRDNRIISTFKNTVKALKEGKKIIIFPEDYHEYNQILCRFQENFVDVAKLYGRQTKENLPFVPMYIAPYLHTMYIGKPIYFDREAPIEEERTRMVEALMASITDIAVNLPEHTVVPYPNLPRKQFRKNTSKEAIIHENTGR